MNLDASMGLAIGIWTGERGANVLPIALPRMLQGVGWDGGTFVLCEPKALASGLARAKLALSTPAASAEWCLLKPRISPIDTNQSDFHSRRFVRFVADYLDRELTCVMGI